MLVQDEAVHIATMLRDDITSGRKTFGAIAEKESHCSSARRQGDLGSFGPGKMQEAFDSATRALKVRALLHMGIPMHSDPLQAFFSMPGLAQIAQQARVQVQ